jgi:hypothetical protein
MNIRSYVGKVFVVESSNSIIRDENLATAQKYQTGENIPTGKNVGDVKAAQLGAGKFMLPGIHDA